jgi:hypothetical protein
VLDCSIYLAAQTHLSIYLSIHYPGSKNTPRNNILPDGKVEKWTINHRLERMVKKIKP